MVLFPYFCLQDYYIDADYQAGDGFSFSGGAYSLLQYLFNFITGICKFFNLINLGSGYVLNRKVFR